MDRFQIKQLLNDIEKKMVFIVGPRQVGKTWISQQISSHFLSPLYLNYDNFDDQHTIREQHWLDKVDLIIFDEIHKMSNWKTYIKGVYDKKLDHQKILVTGSARLDVFRQMGDALTGRFFKHRLMPFSVKEIKLIGQDISFNELLEKGGFPEPILAESLDDVNRWRQGYLDSIISEDVLGFQNIGQLNTMKMLIKLLQRRVGSPVSYSSLARDLNTSVGTIKRYIEILESLFIIFRVSPYSKNIARSILKDAKIYFYDWGMVIGDDAIKYENMVATSLLKHCFALTDYKGVDIALYYIRTKEQKEVDFCFVQNDTITQLIECKYSDMAISSSLAYFSEKYNLSGVQLVANMGNKAERKCNNITVRSAETFLRELFL
jgi:uncharacterized protein